MLKKRLIVVGIFVLLIIFIPGYSRIQELRAKNRSLVNRIDELNQENDELIQQIEKLENDAFYIEKKARDKMGIGKEGEVRYKVIYETEE